LNPYIAHTQHDTQDILKSLGIKNIDELFSDIKAHHKPKSFNIPQGLSEFEVISKLHRLADKNAIGLIPFIGCGFYDHYVPAAVSAVISRGEFYTAYTPYQPECSQGTLQGLFEYQSSICSLTDMEVASLIPFGKNEKLVVHA